MHGLTRRSIWIDSWIYWGVERDDTCVFNSLLHHDFEIPPHIAHTCTFLLVSRRMIVRHSVDTYESELHMIAKAYVDLQILA